MSLRRLTICIAIAIAAPASAHAGDFGRPKPSLLEGLIPQQFWKGPVTGYSSYPLSDLEEELRDRSYSLIRPNEPRGKWNIFIAGFQIAHLLPPGMTSYDHTEYGRMILWTPGRSEASQYNRLLDEPFEGVAPALAQRLAEVVAGLKREGMTVMLSESDLQHSERMVDRVIVIDRGTVNTH